LPAERSASEKPEARAFIWSSGSLVQNLDYCGGIGSVRQEPCALEIIDGCQGMLPGKVNARFWI
jgi:hypothetical protein